ncbi:MAG TPA: ABC transporter permease [Micromonosporaceae bacterium]|nr:ABC transporter permease [Micromonosporaceae bacterium]
MTVETLAAASPVAQRRGLRAIPTRLWVTPLLLMVAVLALIAYVSAQDLDSMEQRVLGADFVVDRVIEHLQLTVLAAAIIVAIAVPLGVALTRPAMRWLTPVALLLANLGQATPALGILVLLALTLGIGFKTALIALVVSALLPVLRNTIVGLQQVDPALVEAARGMGMSSRQILRKVEMPLAVPVILAGLRTAVVNAVGVAAVATFVNAGGLGQIIVAGVKLQRTPVLLVGGVLTAAIALALDWLAGLVEEFARPRGL